MKLNLIRTELSTPMYYRFNDKTRLQLLGDHKTIESIKFNNIFTFTATVVILTTITNDFMESVDIINAGNTLVMDFADLETIINELYDLTHINHSLKNKLL